jgi:hypothetical protein
METSMAIKKIPVVFVDKDRRVRLNPDAVPWALVSLQELQDYLKEIRRLKRENAKLRRALNKK